MHRWLWLMAVVACTPEDPGVDLSGSWDGLLMADGDPWGDLALELIDGGTDLEGQLVVGAGGEIVLDTTVSGIQEGEIVSLDATGPDARGLPATYTYALGGEVDPQGAVPTLSGSFTCTADDGSGPTDCLEGRAGTFTLEQLP